MYSYCYVYVFLLLCMFRSRYSVSLCCSMYCLCVNVYCTTATVCQPKCSSQIYHIIKLYYRNHGRPLKRLLDTWDRNGSTSGPTPWHVSWWCCIIYIYIYIYIYLFIYLFIHVHIPPVPFDKLPYTLYTTTKCLTPYRWPGYRAESCTSFV